MRGVLEQPLEVFAVLTLPGGTVNVALADSPPLRIAELPKLEELVLSVLLLVSLDDDPIKLKLSDGSSS
jgi:hypothetical protein